MLRKLWKSDEGQNLPEYALILTILTAASAAVLSQFVVQFLPAIHGVAGAMQR
jgi:Flp pilus assembly pilin Flp